ncbi:ABC transporter substrate-binding protein [Mesorhizobium sp. VK9D]|uniref:ABC transporter substrate-binding protein n=1 Tax=Mesorhizobium australafricanum TaxID=3072311 RepID=UPI002A2455DA|nr:ABC transporter substrate-binding protein [Mesorhizobium sp. VK9D]MDX8455290.1 ABC transporter substrate-binding protein [Mesorhizobium sp. VK9D]
MSAYIAFGAPLLMAAWPFAALSQNIPDNLKGSGEIVIESSGGTLEAAEKKAFFDPFTRDTGIKVVLVAEDHAKLLASVKLGQPANDIADLAGGQLASWIANNGLEKIDYSYFAKETLASIPEQLRNDFGIGNFTYSAVIGYNTKKFPENGKHPKNWVDFYNVKDFAGKRAISKCEKMVEGGLLEGALLGDGVQPEKLYPLDTDRAFAKIKALMPDVGRWLVAGADGPQSLIDGEADMASTYNGRMAAAKAEGAPVAFSWEQSLVQYDYWAVMKGSPNKENAFKFLAYISRPKPQAVFAEAIQYGPVNEKAFALLPKELAGNLPGAPDLVKKQIFQNYQWWGATGPDGRTNYEVAMEHCVALLSQ